MFTVFNFTFLIPLLFLGAGHKWAQFWRYLGNNSRKKHPIKLKFWRQVVLIDIYVIYNVFWKKSNIYNSSTYSKFAFLVQLWAKFTPWRSSKSKKVNIKGKKLSFRLSKYRKIKALSSPNFELKIQLLFAVFGDFFGKNGWRGQVSTTFLEAPIEGYLLVKECRS